MHCGAIAINVNMDSIPRNKILNFRSETLLELRKMYNLDKPGQMDEAIDLLDNWVKKQEHFYKKDYPREYLERAIILHKGSVERAKSSIQYLCTLKTLLSNCFDKYNIKQDLGYLKKTYSNVILPNLTVDNYRVIYMKFWNDDYSTNMIFDCYKHASMICEYLSANDYCVGFIGVVDYRDINVSNFISALSLVDLNKAMTTLMKGYAYRIKEIHFLTSSKLIDRFIKILKKFLSAKLSNRLYVHNVLESLYEHLPKEILPVELNGNEKSSTTLFDELLDELSTEDNVEFMKEMFTKALVDKSYKQWAEFNEIYAGLDGTFRSLSVD